MSALRLFGWLVFWVLPQEIIRFPIEIYGFGRALVALAILAAVAVALAALARLERVKRLREARAWRWSARLVAPLVKLGLIVPTVFYWIWFYAYTRHGVIGAAAGMAVLVVLGTWRKSWFGMMSGLMGFSWIAFAVVMLMRFPPRPASCPGAGTHPTTRVVLSRETIDRLPGLRWSNPFDVARDPRDGRLFVSHQSAFWTTHLGGQLTAIATDGTIESAAFPAEEMCTLYPDRLALDTAGNRLFAVTSGNGVYCLAEFDVSQGLRFTRLARLGGEAHGIVYDRGRLFVTFWPVADGAALYTDVVIEVLDAADFHSLARFSGHAEEEGKTVATGRRVGAPFVSEDGRRLWAAALEGYLVSLDLDTLEFRETKVPFTLASAVVVDAAHDVAYLLSPIRWRMERLVLSSGEHTTAMAFHAMPQLMLVNPFDQRWYTLSFTTGALVAWFGAEDWSNPPVAHVGRLARAAIVDPASGHVWVASGCGIYEVEPPPWKSP
ncbi:MAG: hypothetical protein IPK07_13010 [Deltaproteobacteria bacterium]|nr:hypothetical protein [Deltaproteobacteria bacterium]